MIGSSVNRFLFIVSSIFAGGLAFTMEEFQGARPARSVG
jgi:hypothetical protein